jgi:tetratricopeptide (TPR) repeat protein
LSRKQKRFLRYVFLAILVAGVGIAGYLYVANAPQRAQQQFDDAMKLMKPGSYPAAIQGFGRAIETWPNLAPAYLERGNAYHILGKDDEALADLEKAGDLNPDLYRAYAAVGAIYRDRKDYRRAMEAYTKSINAKSNVDALYERGLTYESLGDHQKAIEDYDRAIAELPDAPAVYRARGLAKRNLGDEAGYEADRDTADRIEHRRR